MTIHKLLTELNVRDVRLRTSQGELIVHSSGEALEPSIMRQLQSHKAALVDMLGNDRESWWTPPLTITPDMLPLVELTSEQIQWIVNHVPGGASNVQDIYPLAPLQEGIFFHYLIGGEGDPYLLAMQIAFDSRERLQCYLDALQSVIDRHDILRTAVLWQELPQPVQVVWRQVALPVEEVQLEQLSREATAELHDRFDPRHYRMDLSQAPWIRAYIAHDRLQDRWLLHLLLHHLAGDHSTLSVMQSEIEAHLLGRSDSLPPSVPFRELVAQARLGIKPEEHEEFFKHLLGDVDEPTAPFGILDVQGDGTAIRHTTTVLDMDLARRVRARARAAGVSAASLWHVACAQVLARVSGRDDVVFGTVLFGRMQSSAGHQGMGLFINTLPVRIGIRHDGAQASVRQTHMLLAELVRHEHASLALAQHCSAVKPPTPLFTSILNYRHSPTSSAASADVKRAWEGIRVLSFEERSSYPLMLSVDDLGEGFRFETQMRGDIAPERISDLLCTALTSLVTALEEAPDTPICTLNVLPAPERECLLKTWNQTAADYPLDSYVHLQVAQQAALNPDADAVLFEGSRLSYQELHTRSNQLAHHLLRLGVGPEVVVGVCLPRSSDLLLSLLAIWKTGGVYLPLDASLPHERLGWMLDDAQVRVLLTQAKTAEALPPHQAHEVWLDEDWSQVAQHSTDLPPCILSPDQLAYVIYTSGSSGRPKAVAAAHRGLMNRLAAQTRLAPCGEHDRCLHKTAIGFVDAIVEMVEPLVNGRPLVMAGDSLVRDAAALLALIEREQITRLISVPSLARTWLQLPEAAQRLARLRHWTLSGEPLPSDLLSQLQTLLPGCRFLNLYGSAEVGADVTAYSGAPGHAPAVPIGQPLPNTRVFLLDQQLEPVPVGVVGEIYVGGPGLARAYLGQAGNTALRFVANPFGPPGSRLYRTGDLARYQADGTLLFAGRADQQLKIRGVRVEPGEVEAALRAQAGVAEAVVVAHGEDELHRQLVAYVVGDPDLNVEALRVQLRRLLPEALVPGFILVLPELPRTSTGKLDRKRLPSPQQRERIQHYVPPATVTEALLAEIWADVLHLARVSTEDNFFELGGHSLLATQVVARVRERCGIELSLRMLFNAEATLREVAAEVDRSSREAQGLALPPLTPHERGRTAPLSFTQERLWFLEQLGSLNGAYNEFYALQIHGPLNIAALESSLSQMVRRHETLRTCIETTADGQGVQVISEPQSLSLDVLDLSALSASEREQQVREVAGEQARSPFVLSHSLFRVRLLLLEPREHLLLVTIHHIISDYWSHLVFLRELGAFYAAAVEQRPAALPDLPVQYADYTLWQRQWLQGEALEQQMSYWRTQLAGSPAALQLPIDYPRPPMPSYRGARLSFALGRELSQSLLEFGRSQGVTLYMLLLAAFQLLLGRWSRQEDVVIGSPIAGRRQRETEGLIGFFVNTLVLRTDLSGEPSFSQLLARVRDVALGAYAHQDMPFEKLVAELDLARDPSRSPVFQVMFNLWNQPAAPPLASAVNFERLDIEEGTSKFDLNLGMFETTEGLRGRMEYATDLFEASTIERLVASFRTLLQAIATGDGQQSISQLPLLTPEQKLHLLHAWNQTTADYSLDSYVHLQVAQQATLNPDADAVLFEGSRLSYQELHNRSNQLAHHLLRLGVGPEVAVGVCLPRSSELLLSLLAIWKAGGVYLPLDTSLPPERLGWMLDDAQVRVLLTQSKTAEALPPHQAHEVWLDEDWSQVAQHSTDLPPCVLSPDQLAYVIYTSGSSGRPKAVAAAHRGLMNRLAAQTRLAPCSQHDRCLHKTAIGFVDAIVEMLEPLVNGRPLVMAGDSLIRDAAALLALIEREQITRLISVPSLARTWLQLPEAAQRLARLRHWTLSGEPLPSDLLSQLQSLLPGCRFLNLYGSAEVGADVTAYSGAPGHAPAVPIGQPLPNTQVYLLDHQLEPVPVGVVGEIYVGGPGLARAYLGQAGNTALRFVANPFGPPGSRLYRTGDLARYQPDGTLLFAGRADQQLKIRGVRVEPGEVEAALRAQAGVAEAVVVAHSHGHSEDELHRQLVAYVVGDPDLDVEALRVQLRRLLPEALVPGFILVLPELPRTSTGKLDRKRLPSPQQRERIQHYVPPATVTEALLAEIWADVLHLARVSTEDNFFELGGHSLLATQVVARVRERCGVELPLRVLFNTTATLREVAAEVDRNSREAQGEVQGPALPPLTPREHGHTVPLSFTQERLWFLEQLGSLNGAYNEFYAFQIHGSLNIAALESSLSQMVRRHETLRTRIETISHDQGIQVISEPQPLSLDVLDLSALSSSERQQQMREVADEYARSPFVLSHSLFRVRLLRLEPNEHLLLVTIHHIVSDYWSHLVFLRELGAFYAAAVEQRPAALPELPVQYADYALWQREWLQSEALEQQLSYWRTQLAGSPAALQLPIDHARPPLPTYRGARLSFTLGRELSQSLLEFGRSQGVTLYMLLLAAFQLLLGRWSRQEDVIVGSPIAGRRQRETEGLIGFFVNTLVLRTDLSGEISFNQLLARVRDVALGAYAHQDLPFEKLVAELDPDRDPSRHPLFQVMFILQNQPVARSISWPELTLEPLDFEHSTSKFDLLVDMFETPEGLRGRMEYATDLFEASTIERLVASFHTLLQAIAAGDGQQSISQLPLLTPEQKLHLLHAWNQTTADYALDSYVHLQVAQQAALNPDADAVLFEGSRLSYQELHTRSNQLAHHLLRLGVGPEVVVGVCLPRSSELLLSLLAIWKAGGVYLPLDASLPHERLGWMLDDAQVRVLLTQSKTAEALPPHQAHEVWLDEDWSQVAQHSTDLRPCVLSPDQLAYVIYTSGSSGRPKAVAAAHRGLMNRLAAQTRLAPCGQHDRCLHKTAIGFVDAIVEMLEPLVNGRPLVMAGDSLIRDAAALLALIEHQQITRLISVPSLARTWLQLPEAAQRLARLRHWTLSGEPLPSDLLSQLQSLLPGCRFLNLYGSAEVGADVTAYSGAPGHAPAVPIGQPLPNTQVYLLDQQLEPVPVGVVGEIFVGGPGLARAYLGQAGNTALRFVANPFGPPGSRLYRTGDLARYQPDGTLLFAGRADQQLKIRGVRVEPGEVEAALRAQAGVAEAVVVAHGEDELHRQLVAYVVGDPDLDVEALRVQLRRLLPEALVPGFILVLPELPRTSTGKLDRKRLPSPQQRERIQHYVPPATVTEALLAEIWADVLHLARVSTEDNFFELGGHSLLATQVVARVRERCGVELPLRVLFNTTATLREVAAEVDRTSREAQGLAVPPLTRREHGRTAPLSFNQERFWFLEQLGSLNGAYHEFYALQIHGPLNIAALESSLNQMIRRHETLRTHIENTADGQGMQVISEPQPLSLDVLDLSALSASEREQQVREVAGEHARAPFVFSHSLFRIRMLRLEPSEHLLLVTIHHIVSDYWSHLVFLRELGAFYAATLEQRPAALPELPVQYADYSLWQREWLQGEALEQQMSYWRTQLAGSPAALQLPTDHPRPSLPSYRGARLFFELNGELYHSLLEFSRSQGVTFYMLLLAAFQLLLSRWSRQEDIVVGSPIAGRRQRETEGLIGFFVNTLVLRTDLSGEPSFNQLLARVRDVALGAYAHQDLPFEKLVAELDPVRDPSRHPVFQVMFILQNQPVDFFQWPGLQLTALGLQRSSSLLYVHGATKFDLLVDCVESPDGLWGRFEYSTDLFELVTMERMMGSFQTLLEVIAAGDGQQCIAELPLLTPQQKHQVLHTWNQTDTSYPRHRHVYDLIAEQAARTPDAPAITSDGLAMSFRELEHRSNQLAHHLQSLGVAPDTLVGLSKERSISTIVALLGIWKAGGAYLPLDSAYPEERLRFIIEDAKISLVLAPRLDNSLTCNGQIKCVPLDTLALSSYPATRPRIASSPDHLAYVLYTSGSTGRPKGVAVSHGSLANYVNHVVRTFDVASGTGSPLHTTLAFDLTVTALMPSLVAGRPVTLLPEGESELPELAAALAQGQDFSLVKLTPSHLNVLQTAYPETAREGAARAFIIGGEALTAAHLALWRKHSPGIRLINEYGPTETVVGCATYQVDDSTTQTGPIPIGKPIANTQLYILDSRLNPVPVGVVGELCIGGDGLSRGYLGRPGLTGQRFVPNPYGPPSSRLYRTGDLARYLSDGNLEFVGRTDDQVKIRGFRIELAEIEQVLHGHESIADCVIVAREDGERKHLVAYVVAREQGATLDTAALREYLATNLPDYMVPALFVQLPQLPVTPNGKIDRRALPAPNTSEHPQELATPRTPVEEALEQIWCEILNLEHVGIHDNFFEIGGDSIAALQIVARAGHEGIKITVKGMIEHQTIAQIATALAEQPDAAAEDPQETIQEEAAATMPADDEAASSEVLELPLLPAQADMIQLVPDGFQRNITIVVFDCMERMEPARLEEALRHVVMQHDALRIQFWRTESGWRQGVAGAGAVRGQTLIENVDMSAPASAEEDRARTFELVQQLNDSIRLDSPPMIRGLLIEFGERRPQYLMLAVHHLVFDAISGRILREDLQAAYEQLTRGEAVRLPQRTTPMAEWARCLTNYARSEEAARDAQYFQSLGWPSCTPLPRDHVESEPAEIRSVLLTLDERDTEAVLKVRRRFGVQMDDLLLASVIEALSLWTGGRRFAINLMHHGRVNLNGHDISRTIGFFSSTIPMLIDISAAQDGASLLTAVTQQVASIPSQGIVCGVLRHMSDNNLLADLPRPEIRLNHLGMMGRVKKMLFRAPTDPRLEEPVEPAMLHSNPVQHREHLIEVTTAVHGRRLYMQWAYSSHIHRLDTIQQTAQHAIDWLTRMAAQSHAAAAK